MKNQQEVSDTHAKGFGGSDAKIFVKIGTQGVDVLSPTEKKRIMVALGRMQDTTFEGNVYTEAGHLFEDWWNDQHGDGCEREAMLTNDDIKPENFDIFAHADFYVADLDGKRVVFECKYSQDDTDKVLHTYEAQLQWYYLLGVDEVWLVHGCGGVLPFNVEGVRHALIERDEAMVQAMLDGISILDNAVTQGAFDELQTETLAVEQVDDKAKDVLVKLTAAMRAIKEAEADIEAKRAELLAWMEAHGVLNIKGEGFTVSYVSPTTRRTFDTKKAQAKHPDLTADEFYKVSQVKSSVKINLDK